MVLSSKKEKAKKQVAEEIREIGGVANIESPVKQVLEPAVEEVTPSKFHYIWKDIKDAEKQDSLPMRVPEKPTIKRVAKRIIYEELMLAARDGYQELTGEDIQLNLSGSDLQTGEEQ
ncbi:hypothetical protein [Haloplanus natans]|uniref:hypothetical protein n=1 Tax=Haloplanus natans TaxID=376171 RepID=UPI0006782F78|nr:hypothetical protein [Haloplanus natans]